jgi:hypothetical protein
MFAQFSILLNGQAETLGEISTNYWCVPLISRLEASDARRKDRYFVACDVGLMRGVAVALNAIAVCLYFLI